MAQRVSQGLKRKVTLNETSEVGPSLASFSVNGRLYIAWSGTRNHQLNVMYSDDNGASFKGKVTLQETSAVAPAIAEFNGKLYLAWTGTDPTHHLNVLASSDGTNWANKVTLNELSLSGPALAPFLSQPQPTLCLGWTGVSNNQLNALSSKDGQNWTNKNTQQETSIADPALAEFNSKLCMAWTGTDSRHRLNVNASPGIPFNFGSKVTLNETSERGPALSMDRRGRLFISWSGVGNRRINLLCCIDPPNVSGPMKVTLDDTCIDRPTLDREFLGWTGTDDRHRLNVAEIDVPNS